MHSPAASRNVYALLVGIDKYQPPVPALAGCVNDMLAMKEFLEQRTFESGFTLHKKVLMDHEATRSNIVRAFEEHLGQAKEGDVAFFYFSGHGSQEPAHRAFWEIEPDHMNETLVCYDSRSRDGMDLADKELATLIEMVAAGNPHMLVVMDCCHSGSGTREIPGDHEPDFVARQSPDYDKVRTLDSYILPRKTGERGALSTGPTQQLTIARGRHVSLTGAHSFQLAKETRLGGQRRGVFTYSLLEVLNKATGPVSYADIMRRVKGLVTQRTYEQNPQLFAHTETDRELAFLGGAIKDKPPYFLLTYNNQKGWVLDGGGVHGIMAPGSTGERTVLAVYPDNTSAEDMADRRKALGTVSVSRVEAGSSQVQVDSSLRLDLNQAYRTRIISLPVDPMKVCIRGNAPEGIELAKRALIGSNYSAFLRLVDSSADADFNLIAKQDLRDATRDAGDPERLPGFIITRPTDRDDQPLVEQLPGLTAEQAEKAIEYLNHIARWKRILEISNPASSIPTAAIKVELLNPENQPIQAEEGEYVFRYFASAGEDALPRFKVKITNTSDRKLYCSMLYMSSQFGIETQLFPEGGIWLEPGQESWVLDGQVFTGSVADELVVFGKNETVEIFKLIVSASEYDAGDLRQPELKLPKLQYRGADIYSTRGLMFSRPTNNEFSDWNTTELPMRLVRQT